MKTSPFRRRLGHERNRLMSFPHSTFKALEALSRDIRPTTGYSLAQWLINARLHAAQQFKRHFGVSPKP